MVSGTNIDIFLIFVLASVSLVGLIRGFLSELASIINWVGSAYFASALKPIIVRLLSGGAVPSPLVNIAASLSLFIIIVIIMSIVNRILVERARHYMPASINGGLGFLFGFIKGVLFISLVLSSVNLLSKRRNIDILSNSLVNDIMTKSDGFFMKSINGIMEGFIGKSEPEQQETIEETEEDMAIIEQAREISRKSGRINDHVKIKEETKKNENTDLDKLINILE
jgi:membrane protein required for colicin V production